MDYEKLIFCITKLRQMNIIQLICFLRKLGFSDKRIEIIYLRLKEISK